MFVFYGTHKAVLIDYSSYDSLTSVFSAIGEK